MICLEKYHTQLKQKKKKQPNQSMSKQIHNLYSVLSQINIKSDPICTYYMCLCMVYV